MNSIITRERNRNRLILACLMAVVIIAGLSSRKFDFFPDFFQAYMGDTLWAVNAYLVIAFVFKRASILRIGIYSLSFSYLIEISQFYHAPWIDSIRNTTLGALILGFGFLWSDILCYTTGIFLAMMGDAIFSETGRATR